MKLLLISLRATSLVSKFALTVYIAKFLGLEPLGTYGVLTAVTIILPAALGFGLNGPTFRGTVTIDGDAARRILSLRVTISAIANILAQPILYIFYLKGNLSFTPTLAVYFAVVSVGEHVLNDIHGVLISRRKILLANVILFLRSGLWPILFMILAFFVPPFRTIDVMLQMWAVGLLACGIIILIKSDLKSIIHEPFAKLTWLIGALRGALPFYLYDIGAVGSQYVDRFIITSKLGLRETGIFTFFWSIANAVSALTTVGVAQSFHPQLVTAAVSGDRSTLTRISTKMQKETVASAASMSILIVVSMYLILPYLNKPGIREHFVILIVMLFGVVARVWADSLHSVLYASNRDISLASISILGIAVSAISNSFLVQSYNLYGAAVAMILTSFFLLIVRYTATRQILKV